MDGMQDAPAVSRSPRRASRGGVGLGTLSVVAAVALVAGAAGSLGTRALFGDTNVGTPSVALAQSAQVGDLQSAVESVSQKVGPAVVEIRTDEGLGSGVIYDASGLILTNDHVVEGANTISVGLGDGRHFQAKVLGQDAGFDLAVLKIDGQNLPAANLGTSNGLQAGQFVVAIGNPYGFDHTVTLGVVSGVNRPVNEGQGSYNQPMIQTDTAINPGNSGGPLIDLDGNVIGINTLVGAPDGVPAPGLGFAVPVDTAKRIAPQLAQNGHVTDSGQPFLGVSLSDAGRPSAVPGQPGFPMPGFPNEPGFPQPGNPQPAPQPAPRPGGADHGAVVGQVSPDGPAAQAGLQPNDVITSFDGKDIYSSDELLQALVLHKPGDQVTVTVLRNGQSQNLTLTIGDAPASQG
ncbi:MAG: trypsin-like peptidase domain-containing protein [Chloroflexi bacterium]|nr:trypsin-like peptidase domain-containing protein [Chloroflexota bacterium]